MVYFTLGSLIKGIGGVVFFLTITLIMIITISNMINTRMVLGSMCDLNTSVMLYVV